MNSGSSKSNSLKVIGKFKVFCHKKKTDGQTHRRTHNFDLSDYSFVKKSYLSDKQEGHDDRSPEKT